MNYYKSFKYSVLLTTVALTSSINANEQSINSANTKVDNELVNEVDSSINKENTQQPAKLEEKTSKSKLLSLLNSFNTLNANFTQIVRDEDNNVLQQGNGNFSLAKPNLLHWQTLAPDESTIISDGETLWLYDPFIEQATAYSLANSINNTPILLLMNQDDNIWSQYNIDEVAVNNFKITSIDNESQIQSLILTFSNNELSSFVINDITGQRSEFTLAELKVSEKGDSNASSSSLYTFSLPEGAVLDDQR